MSDPNTEVAASERPAEPIPWTPELIIAQYILSAWMLGARFGGDGKQPIRGYELQTARVALRDLADHGFAVAREVPASDAAPVDTPTTDPRRSS